MLVTEVVLYGVYVFDNGILMQCLRQELHSCFHKEGGFFLKHERKGRCFFATGSKTVCTKVSRITKKYITSTYMQVLIIFLTKTKATYKETKLSKIHNFSI